MFDFDLSNGYVVLRIICGFFYIPHAIAKIQDPAGPAAFFKAAGYPYPELCVTLGLVFEFLVGGALILGIYTELAAWLSTIFLTVAGLSVLKVNKKWTWHTGGGEFPLFWAACCVVVALHA